MPWWNPWVLCRQHGRLLGPGKWISFKGLGFSPSKGLGFRGCGDIEGLEIRVVLAENQLRAFPKLGFYTPPK